MALPLLGLRSTYPCCGRQAFFEDQAALPKESYFRRCRACRTTWHVERTSLPHSANVERIDKLEWLDTATRLYTNLYGTSPVVISRAEQAVITAQERANA